MAEGSKCTAKMNRSFMKSSVCRLSPAPRARGEERTLAHNMDLLGAAELLFDLYGARAAEMAKSRAERLSARGLDRPAAIWRAVARTICEQHAVLGCC